MLTKQQKESEERFKKLENKMKRKAVSAGETTSEKPAKRSCVGKPSTSQQTLDATTFDISDDSDDDNDDDEHDEG